MKTFFAFLLLTIQITTTTIFSQTSNEEQKIKEAEVSAWFGDGEAFEDNIFNTETEKLKASPAAVYKFCVHYPLDQNLSLGIIIEAFTQKISAVTVTLADGQMKSENFDLACSNLGVEAKWTFAKGTLEPYGFGNINWTGGSLQNPDLGNLALNGLSIGGGFGTKLNFSESWAIAFEAFGFWGTATWKEKVFTNSIGNSFNPSHVAATLGIVFHWVN